MAILHWFEGIRLPWLNDVMLAVTQLGEETAFLALALLVFWCVDKKRGYYLMCVGFAGTMVNQFVKLWCRVPRPWVREPGFTAVEEAKAAAGGYSFPSGHSQTAVGTFGAIGCTTRRRWLRLLCLIPMLAVPVSRMYLGVHTLSDVLTGTATALCLVALLRKPVLEGSEKTMKCLIAGMTVMAIGLIANAQWFPFPADLQEENRLSCLKNGCTMVGCLAGMAVVYLADRKLAFPVKAVWWVQILKTVLGLGLVVLAKSALKGPLELLMPVYPARAVRYFLVVLLAGILWPLTFRWFEKLGAKAEAV